MQTLEEKLEILRRWPQIEVEVADGPRRGRIMYVNCHRTEQGDLWTLQYETEKGNVFAVQVANVEVHELMPLEAKLAVVAEFIRRGDPTLRLDVDGKRFAYSLHLGDLRLARSVQIVKI